MPYSEKYQDPHWQKIRLKIFERDGWKCQEAKCRSSSTTPLAVHHKSYKARKDPWDYPLELLITLCQKCHEKTHGITLGEKNLVERNFCHWASLTGLLGFKPQGYLTEDGNNILCGCFRLDYNPDAPSIVLPGDDEGVARRAKKFFFTTHTCSCFYQGTGRALGILRKISCRSLHDK